VQAFNSYLCSSLHVAHAHRMRGYRWADEPAAIKAMQRKVPESVAACYALIEHKMLEAPWVMGETYTICDPYLFTMSQWLAGWRGSFPVSEGSPTGAGCRNGRRFKGRFQMNLPELRV
jgi:glutathione S-transferase